MFWNLYKYRLKCLINNKSLIFWTAIFPILLGTFFALAFSNISSKTENMERIKVAVVDDGTYQNEEEINAFIDQMNTKDGYLKVTDTDMEEAGKLLKKGKVEGIINISTNVSVKIKENGMNQTILKSMIDSYLQGEELIIHVMKSNPSKLNESINALYSDKEFNKEKSISSGNMDPFVQYYFALFAMTCLFGATLGLANTVQIQANQTVVAIRRNVCPTRKIYSVVSDFMAALTIQMIVFVIVFFYLNIVMGIDFGNNYGYILLAGLAANLTGISYGYFIGVLVKAGENVKNGIISGTVLSMCFLAGLMVANMNHFIETHAPIVNKINPAAVISDSFYSVCVVSGKSMYIRCIATLICMSIIFGTVSVMILRREKYADF